MSTKWIHPEYIVCDCCGYRVPWEERMDHICPPDWEDIEEGCVCGEFNEVLTW